MLYDIGFFIFSLIYLPILIFKGKFHKDFLQRFGIFDKDTLAALRSQKEKIWIQAVSVGEVGLCRIFLPLLKERYPDREIILSTITKTGYDFARSSFSRSAAVIYFPLDFSFIVRRVARLIRPKIYIMVETEIWPNLLKTLKEIGTRSAIVNGRISDRSVGKYMLIRRFLKRTLDSIDLFCMRSPQDEARIIAMGASREKVVVTGNMKFDINFVSSGESSSSDLRKALGLGELDPLFVAGSTHSGEEEAVINVYKGLLKDYPDLKLLIAPRHVERSGEVEALIRRAGYEPVRISAVTADKIASAKEGQSPAGTVPLLPRNDGRKVFILDTIGRLKDIYSIASIVFVGGSLVKHGGQNPIEPASCGKAVIFGPWMFNFEDTASAFLDNEAAVKILNREGLLDKARLLLKDGDLRTRLGERAKEVILQNRGATERNLRYLRTLTHA